MSEQFDVVILGSGVGGGTVARRLAATGARILVVERGEFIPQEPENWDPAEVWGAQRYRTPEMWLDRDDNEFSPYTHYCVGGNSKFWGSVLYRLREEDFGELQHLEGTSPAWPIDYATLAPYYDRAERMYSVHCEAGLDPTEPPRGPFPNPPVQHQGRIAKVAERLRDLGLNPSHQPLGVIEPNRDGGCILCATCNSFPCQLRRKSDADVCAVSPALDEGEVTLWTGSFAERLITNESGDRVVAAEITREGGSPSGGESGTVRVEAPLFVVSCGAVNSSALMLRSAGPTHPDGLANSSGLVGRRYMAHLSTMIGAFMPRTHDTEFAKTLAVNDYYLRGPNGDYPLGNIQSQGRAYADMAKAGGSGLARHIPAALYRMWFERGSEWLAMTEDLPDPDNRVTLTDDGRIRLTYQPHNTKAHAELLDVTRKMLRKVGFWAAIPVSMGVINTTHQCGTMVFGDDPSESVLDPFCRTHDVDNLFVVDASFFPSSAAVNPGLTVAAQALRSADHIADTHL
ncbi:MAG TPA: GMC family oxidoreductase [Longimicrobiales bacterium]|nr:GMC family oxidoreductase [Longimicrobiales bacterium]